MRFSAASTCAGVVVLANRTTEAIRFSLTADEESPRDVSLEANGLMPMSLAEGATVSWTIKGNLRSYQLSPSSVYFFYKDSQTNEIDLQQLSFQIDPQPAQANDLVPQRPPVAKPATPKADDGKTTNRPTANSLNEPIARIEVKILVDDDERAANAVWQERLRKRLEAANEVLQRESRLRFEIVAYGTWRSDNATTEFSATLREFEKGVQADPAQVAIGFTSQYPLTHGPTHLGGTRGPLHSHILVREWSQHISEPERLEVLLHELGHYLGAVHSPEADSTMRPKLGDRRALAKKFHIGFDAVNALAVNLVTDEIRTRGVTKFKEISPATRERLAEIYVMLGKALPTDSAATVYLGLLRGAPLPAGPLDQEPFSPLIEATRTVVRAIVQTARVRAQPLRPGVVDPADVARIGDERTAAYVRSAASAAIDLPEEHRVRAFLLGLAMAIDSSDLIRQHPLTAGLCRGVESDAERKQRLEVLGSPSLSGRHDLAQHFFVSAGLTTLVGPRLAEAAGLAKELQDAQGGSGFSFCDLCADLAGVALAERVQRSPDMLTDLSKSFRQVDYLPSTAGLVEGLTREQFVERFGTVLDERFQQVQGEIRKRIEDLNSVR